MIVDLKIQQLRYVVAIVQSGSFHTAAQQLNRSQPALSMAVRDLEQRLGDVIFEKKSHATLTPFGHYCLPRFQELLHQHDRLSRDLTARINRQSGQVDIATVPSIASRLMPNLLAGFAERWPGLGINLHDGNAESVRGLVLNGEVDLALTSLWNEDQRLSFTPLIRDQVGVVCRHDHPLAVKKEIDWQELAQHSLILNGTSLLLEKSDAGALVEHSHFSISNMISLIAMLEAGVGITTLPRLAFPEGHATLRFIALRNVCIERTIGLLSLSGRTMTPAANAMAQFILEYVPGHSS